MQQSEAGTISQTFAFKNVDWPSLLRVYGWTALQYQAWARTTFTITPEACGPFGLHVQGVLEYWVDNDRYFGGDLYGFGKAPLVLTLAPGTHSLELRLTRDVRAMSAQMPPEVSIRVAFTPLGNEVSSVHNTLLLPDIAGGQLASSPGSVCVTNSGEDACDFTLDSESEGIEASLAVASDFEIAHGQTRPLAFSLKLKTEGECLLKLKIGYRFKSAKKHRFFFVEGSFTRRRQLIDVQKVTFRHPGGVVSYCMLRPGSPFSSIMPVMLNLHGAGLEADSSEVIHSFDGAGDLLTSAWLLFPSGGTPWSGDDWHQWGWADVEASIRAIRDWMKQMRWPFGDVDGNRWLVVGHSNGGQGVWHALANCPDKIFAAAPVSGYSSIQKYVPYESWRESDPSRQAVVQRALTKYRHELIAPLHARGIKVAIQHGSADGNVPSFHSRRMNQLLLEQDASVQYNEIHGADHWFDGIMTTKFLNDFYEQNLDPKNEKPPTVDDFETISADPSTTGSKFGVHIRSLTHPGQTGRVHVRDKDNTLHITSSGVRILTLDERYGGYAVRVNSKSKDMAGVVECSMVNEVFAVYMNADGAVARAERTTREALGNFAPGGLDAILKTHGAFSIRGCKSDVVRKASLQVARNLLQYFGADAQILEGREDGQGIGNVISIGVGDDEMVQQEDFPLQIQGDSILLKKADGLARRYVADTDGLASIFLRSHGHGRLDMVIWGSDAASLDLAVGLAPTVTGVGQPDFMLLNQRCRWMGIEGTLALGFFNEDWEIVSATSCIS